ncbi:MAG TPA: hypothetical protein VGM05_02440 [Planctomycetaceae bacterium]
MAPNCLRFSGWAEFVPGSVGVKSMRSLPTNETTSGLAEAIQMMMLVAMALASGLLFGRSMWQAFVTRYSNKGNQP